MAKTISWQDFEQLDIRVGTVLTVSDFPEARKPAFQLQVDFGAEVGILRTSAQITDNYERQALVGKQVLAVVNFPKKQIANFMSECLILGLVGNEGVILVMPDRDVPNGLKLG
ncbi:MAG: tRNA-binding protein [Leeuwenhoekiella sp.]